MIRTARHLLLAMLVLVVTACAGAEEPTIESGALQASPQQITSDDDDAAATEDGSSEAKDDTASPSPAPADDATTEPTEERTPRTFEEACAGREDEAFIEVLTPLEDSTVGDPITVTGCGNTFEANYIYRLEDADGTVLVEDFGTMTCGNGCVGEFTFEVTAGTTGDVLLVVFETSAEDGSPQSVVEVPLTVEA